MSSALREHSLDDARGRWRLLLPLFFVSMVGVCFEIALTRYFAIANWSEYGYWAISIAMAGFSVSGVALSVFKDALEKRAYALLSVLPLVLMVCAAIGFCAVTWNPFNPLELQNPLLMARQAGWMALYYVALFPFFFLTGAYIGLFFLKFQKDIPKVYAVDLAGAGIGAIAILCAMFWIHPFLLVPFFLPGLAIAAWLAAGFQRLPRAAFGALSILVLVGCELFLAKGSRADFNEYKSIYAPLHVEDNRVVASIRSPRGYFNILDNFTERLDIDLSNNRTRLGAAPAPRTFGLYKDGQRISSLLKDPKSPMTYTQAALDTGVYRLYSAPKVVLIGTRGGFRVREVFIEKPAALVALEPDETLYSLVQPAFGSDSSMLRRESPAEFARRSHEKFDIIDVASDFLDQSYANRFAFTEEALVSDLKLLQDGGVVSVPVSIREFTVYAVKLLHTARRALAQFGVAKPADHLVIYRSAWNARILLFRDPVSPQRIETLRRFCDERSFDLSYYPGIDPAKINVWNDLPAVSFDSDQLEESDQPSDALRDQSLQLLGASPEPFLKSMFFNVSPMTADRPFFYCVLKLSRWKTLWQKISLVPREEIGSLINAAVLVQAIVLALVVLCLPLFKGKARRSRGISWGRSVSYFSALGLGFLFIEITIIDKAAFYLNDAASAFALVLGGMLVFSGVGSYVSGKSLTAPRTAVRWTAALAILWIVLAVWLLDSFMNATLGLPYGVKAVVVLLLIAPLSIALGYPFPLGLSQFQGTRSDFLPWAWSLNGAFSVVATPLANLLAVMSGYSTVLLAAAVLYAAVGLLYPEPNQGEL